MSFLTRPCRLGIAKRRQTRRGTLVASKRCAIFLRHVAAMSRAHGKLTPEVSSPPCEAVTAVSMENDIRVLRDVLRVEGHHACEASNAGATNMGARPTKQIHPTPSLRAASARYDAGCRCRLTCMCRDSMHRVACKDGSSRQFSPEAADEFYSALTCRGRSPNDSPGDASVGYDADLKIESYHRPGLVFDRFEAC